jgi:hypothetical protein
VTVKSRFGKGSEGRGKLIPSEVGEDEDGEVK